MYLFLSYTTDKSEVTSVCICDFISKFVTRLRLAFELPVTALITCLLPHYTINYQDSSKNQLTLKFLSKYLFYNFMENNTIHLEYKN